MKLILLLHIVLATTLLSACGSDTPQTQHSQQSVMAAAPAMNSFLLPRANYNIVRLSDGSYTVTALSDASITSLPASTTVIQFSDMRINLGISETVKNVTPANLQALIELYIAYFNRLPDADGLEYWVNSFKTGQSLEQIGASFYRAAIQFSDLSGYTASMTNSDFVTKIYQNVLGRTPDERGLAYWSGELNVGRATRGTLIRDMLYSAHSYKGDASYGYVADLLDNKLKLAVTFAVQQGINYNTSEASISHTMTLASLVSSQSTDAAVAQMGRVDWGFTRTSILSGVTIPTMTVVSVSTQTSEGVSFSSLLQSVETNMSALFSVQLASGYKDLHVTGCGLDFNASDAGTYTLTTPSITAACTLIATATKNAVSKSYNVKLAASEGMLFLSGTNATVNPGGILITNVALKTGFKDIHVTGCGVNFFIPGPSERSEVITTPTIDADCTLTGSATRIVSADGPYMLYGIGQSSSADFLNINDSFTLEARVSGKFAKLVATIYDGRLDGISDPGKPREVVMSSQGDGLYTAKITLPPITKLYLYSGQEGAIAIFVRALDEAGNEIYRGDGSVGGNILSHVVVDSNTPAPTMSMCAPNASRNANIINVIGDFLDEASMLTALRSCVDTSQLDFIMRFPIGHAGQYVGSSYASPMHSDIEGIGTKFSSPFRDGFPRLLSFQTIGVSANYDTGTLLHEVMHTWGFYLKKDGLDLTGGNGAHFGPSNVNGMLGQGSYLRLDADGGATVDDSARPRNYRYDPLEQYLAGWRDASEVPPRYFAVNKPQMISQGTKIPQSDLVLASPDWIAAQFGAHKTHNGSPFQKDFNMAMVVVSSAPLTQAEIAHFSFISRYFEGTSGPESILPTNRFEMNTSASFFYATEGRASIKTRVVPK